MPLSPRRAPLGNDEPQQRRRESVTMATIEISARRLLLAGGFAIAVAATPAVASFSFAPAAGPSILACPNGESTDIYNGECIPDLVPNSPEIPFGSVDGVPCAGHNSGQCIGLEQEQQSEGPAAVPHSSVDGQNVG
jgi:hypothetical protein